jgi:F-type H+-transporting ATPase subunit delta
LQPALLNPVLTAQQKENLLLAACGVKDISTTMKRFVTLVNEKKRASLMLFIAHSYIKLYREKMNLVVGKLILPTAVSEALKAKLQKLIEAKVNCKMDFQVEEDPTIGGGFILEYDTYRLDASLRTQLKQILKELK